MFEGINGDVEVVRTSIKDKSYPERRVASKSCDVVAGRCRREV